MPCGPRQNRPGCHGYPACYATTNDCPACSGIAVQIAVESLSSFSWNRCPGWRGIRTFGAKWNSQRRMAPPAYPTYTSGSLIKRRSTAHASGDRRIHWVRENDGCRPPFQEAPMASILRIGADSFPIRFARSATVSNAALSRRALKCAKIFAKVKNKTIQTMRCA